MCLHHIFMKSTVNYYKEANLFINLDFFHVNLHMTACEGAEHSAQLTSQINRQAQCSTPYCQRESG
jgi:hypothetical protein